jgi:hypothetical protein
MFMNIRFAFARTAICAYAFFAILSASTFADVSAPWTQYQADAKHTGHVTGTFGTAQPSLIWSVAPSSLGEQSLIPGAVIDANHVYIAAPNSYSNGFEYADVLALDRATGTKDWSRLVSSYSGVSAPSIGNGMVYVHQWGHSGISGGNAAQYPYVTGINATTGAIQFATSHSGQWSSGSRPTVDGSQVFAAGGYYGGLDAYSSTSGSHLWFSNVNQQYGWIPAADAQRVYVYMGPASASPGPNTGTLYAFNRASGGLDYTILNPGDSFTLYQGTVSLGGQSDALTLTRQGLTSFDLTAHNVRWTAPCDGAFAIDQGLVFASNGIELDLLSESTGAKLNSWFAPPGTSLTGNLLVTDDTVIVGTSGGTFGISRAAFSTAWSLPRQGDLALGNNVLLISSNTGLYAYAIPEPASFVLFSTLGLVLALFNRRRSSA